MAANKLPSASPPIETGTVMVTSSGTVISLSAGLLAITLNSNWRAGRRPPAFTVVGASRRSSGLSLVAMVISYDVGSSGRDFRTPLGSVPSATVKVSAASNTLSSVIAIDALPLRAPAFTVTLLIAV